MKPRHRAEARTLVLALAAGLSALGLGRLFLHHYQPEVETVFTGFHGEAATDPLLAAERVLRRLGYPVRRTDGDTALPPSDHVLLMAHRSIPVARLRTPALLAWVRNGGRLIVTPAQAWGTTEADPLLVALGVDLKDVAAGAPFARRGRFRMSLAPVQSSGVVRASAVYRLVDTRQAAIATAHDGLGKTVLVFALGRGELTVVSDASCLENGWIGEGDHAAFLLWLVLSWHRTTRLVPPPGIDISAYDDMPNLVTFLAQTGWMAVVPILLLVLAAAWRAASRFGALLPDPPEERRGLLEHLDAAGRWTWHADRGSQRATLVEAVRRSLRERLETRRPSWSKLSEPERIARLGAAASLPPQVVAAALHTTGIDGEAGLLSAVRTLALLRRSL